MERKEELEAWSACHKTFQAFGQVSGVGNADFRNFIIQSRSRFKQTGNGGFGTHERKIHARSARRANVEAPERNSADCSRGAMRSGKRSANGGQGSGKVQLQG